MVRELLAEQGWRRAAILCGFILVAWMGWRAPNYVMEDTPSWDSGGAMMVAGCMRGGRILYRDVFEHKPPLRFFISYLCMTGDDLGVDTVRYVEKFVAAGKAVLIAAIFTAFTARPILALLLGMFFVLTMYNPIFFNGGNLSEEYGNFFQLLAMLFCTPIFFKRYPAGSLFLVGFLSCSAGLVKEPFAFSCLPWLCYAVLLSAPPGRLWIRSCCWVVGGVIAALLPFVLYFSYHGAMGDWLYSYIFNIEYARLELGVRIGFWVKLREASVLLSGNPYGIAVCLLLSLPALINAHHEQRQRYFPLAVLFGFCGAIAAAIGVTNRFLHNYRIFLVPMWCLLVGVMIDGLISLPAIWPSAYARFSGFMARRWRPCAAAAILVLAAAVAAAPITSILVCRGVGQWSGAAASALRDGILRLGVPASSWKKPVTTLEKLLPAEIVTAEGILLMAQRPLFYYNMHSLMPPTKPFVGISNGIVGVRPDYLDDCLELMMEEPPAVFIGRRRVYGYVIDKFMPALEKNYHFLGTMPLYAEKTSGRDWDYQKPLFWYVRKDLYPLIDQEYVAGAIMEYTEE